MKRYAPFLIVGIAAIFTCTWATMLYRTKIAERQREEEARAVEAGKRRFGRHAVGNPSAKITIEEFGDFQCPPCGLLAEPLNQMVKDFQPNVRLVFRNLPLPVHAHAREAALAAEAAGLQGKFWEMHDLLYRQQATWSKAPDVQPLFSGYAESLGLDVKRFALDSMSENTHELVESDELQGKKLGVTNTPTIFLNDHAVNPKDLAPDSLRSAIKALLEKPAEAALKK